MHLPLTSCTGLIPVFLTLVSLFLCCFHLAVCLMVPKAPRPSSLHSTYTAARGCSCPEWLLILLAKSDLWGTWDDIYVWTHASEPPAPLIWFWLWAANQTSSARPSKPMEQGSPANGWCKQADGILSFFLSSWLGSGNLVMTFIQNPSDASICLRAYRNSFVRANQKPREAVKRRQCLSNGPIRIVNTSFRRLKAAMMQRVTHQVAASV